MVKQAFSSPKTIWPPCDNGDYAYAIVFIVYSIQVFSSHDNKVKKRKKKKKRGGHYKTAAAKRLSFFLSIKAYVKRSDVAYF